MASLVNLDALLPREDLAERDDVPNFSSIRTIGITQLEAGFFSNALRKPDFQRETSDWTPVKVFDLIRAFVDGELVPPVILWQAGGCVFVIDGAHWADFEAPIRTRIETLAKDIRVALYEPPLQTPIKTLDLPVAGSGYGALPFIFDLVNLANDIRDASKGDKEREPEKDDDGTKTVAFLESVARRVARISGTESVSLGVHPTVYFNTLGGQFQPSAFLATSEFLEELEREDKLVAFSKVRASFEEFLVTHKTFISQIVHKQGSGGRSRTPIKSFYRFVADSLWAGEDGKETLVNLIQMPAFDFLKPGALDEPSADKKDFSRGIKTAAFLTEALDGAVRCAICNARLHRNSIHTDHKERRRDGGGAGRENAQLSHPYCNSTVKN